MKGNETIAAIASHVGIGAITVIRISGTNGVDVGDRVLKKPISKQEPNKIVVNEVIDNNKTTIDVVMAVLFKAPNSYTGEDMIEIYCHGGYFIPFQILDQITNKGARIAEPGEFTLRSVLNGKLDLIQAEAILDLIEAKSLSVAKIAVRNLKGKLSDEIGAVVRSITDVLVQVEGNLDFPEDEQWNDIDKIRTTIADIDKRIGEIAVRGNDGILLRDGPMVVLAGRKNVGKSTLFNTLLGIDRAIVAPAPGTTRDYLMENYTIGEHFVRLVDTAGLGTAGEMAEEEGIRRTKALVDNADLLILILDRSEVLRNEDERYLESMREKNKIVVLNKTDLPKKINFTGDVEISAINGDGVNQLKELIKERLFPTANGDQFILRKRQLDSLTNGKKYVESALNQNYLETISSDLRNALEQLGELTGRITNQNILDKIFSEFCIGK